LGAKDISYLSLFFCFLLLVIPIGISLYFKVKLIKSTLIAVFRMAIQLALIGLFLEYIFKLNNPMVNILWVLIMIVVASFTVIGRSELNLKIFYLPIFISFIISNALVVIYFTSIVIKLDNILEAKYLIAISGMLLGNCLRSNIIGITHFYENIKRDENRYLYNLSLGASKYEVLLPYFSNSISIAMKPTIASMSVIGLVSLPGMMTGQILGGSNPLVAIKYQMAIMIAILVSTGLSVLLTILFTVRSSFNSYGILKDTVFNKNKDNSKPKR
jgi:putative ABC transport system permease protein